MRYAAFARLTVLGALLALPAMLPQPAEAVPLRLRVETLGAGAAGVVITDEAAGDLALGAPGVILFSGGMGGFVVTVTTGISNSPGGPLFSELTLNNVSVLATGPGTLRITLEDDDFTHPAHKLVANVGGVLSAGAGSTARFDSWINLGNLVPDLGLDDPTVGLLPAIGAIPAGSLDAFGPTGITFGPGAFSGTGTVGFGEDTQYSLFSQATVSFTGPGSVSFNLTQQAVPMPATLLLVFVALPVIGLALRRNAPRRS